MFLSGLHMKQVEVGLEMKQWPKSSKLSESLKLSVHFTVPLDVNKNLCFHTTTIIELEKK